MEQLEISTSSIIAPRTFQLPPTDRIDQALAAIAETVTASTPDTNGELVSWETPTYRAMTQAAIKRFKTAARRLVRDINVIATGKTNPNTSVFRRLERLDDRCLQPEIASHSELLDACVEMVQKIRRAAHQAAGEGTALRRVANARNVVKLRSELRATSALGALNYPRHLR